MVLQCAESNDKKYTKNVNEMKSPVPSFEKTKNDPPLKSLRGLNRRGDTPYFEYVTRRKTITSTSVRKD